MSIFHSAPRLALLESLTPSCCIRGCRAYRLKGPKIQTADSKHKRYPGSFQPVDSRQRGELSEPSALLRQEDRSAAPQPVQASAHTDKWHSKYTRTKRYNVEASFSPEHTDMSRELPSPSKENAVATSHPTLSAVHRKRRSGKSRAEGFLASLFPAEVGASESSGSSNSRPGKARDIPLQTFQFLPNNQGRQSNDDFQEPEFDLDERFQSYAPRKRRRPVQYEASSVLRLTVAGKHLTHDDFRRVMPEATHLEGWMPDRDFKVVQERHILSLKPSGSYLLVFKKNIQAQQYQKRFLQLHSAAQLWSPSSAALNEEPDATNKLDGPENSSEYPKKLVGYTLLPRSRAKTRLSSVRTPLSAATGVVVDHLGLPVLMADRVSTFQVLLRTEGRQPTPSELSSAIHADERHRQLKWSIVTDGGVSVRLIEHPRDFTLRRKYLNSNGSVKAEHQGLGQSRTRCWRAFVVAFKSQADASRFACRWHGRDIAPLLQEVTQGAIPAGEESVMQAEVLATQEG